MSRTTMTSIARTCPSCGTPNNIRIITTDIRPSWNINCSRCGVRIIDRRGARAPAMVEAAPAPGKPVIAKPEPVPVAPPPGAGAGSPSWALPGHGLSRTVVRAAVGAACGALMAFLLAGELPTGVLPNVTVPVEVAPAGESAPRMAALRRPSPHAPRPGARSAGSDPWPEMLRDVAQVEEAAYPPDGGLADPQQAAAAEEALELSARERREVQRRLRLAGHDPRIVDGIFGPATRAAIADWQEAIGIPASGYLDGQARTLLAERTEADYRAWRTAENARRERERLAALQSPVPTASPARAGADGCRRLPSGKIAYGQGVRCDLRGLRENVRGLGAEFRDLGQKVGFIKGSDDWADGA